MYPLVITFVFIWCVQSFWAPSMTPQAESRVEKPDTDTYCPATGNKLRLKDLIPVKFTKVPTDSESEGRFMDPVTKVRGEMGG